VGTIGGKGPGEEANVFLAPTETEIDVGRVAGEVDLFIPTGRMARVQTSAFESSEAVHLSVEDDGSVLLRKE
jgi:hypothetical protein